MRIRAPNLFKPGSSEAATLANVYEYYHGRKHRFEALAAIVAGSVVRRSGARYREGWITSATSDHGVDFVGRVDLGTGLARTKLVLLGQAKCELPRNPTNGTHIARTVARLRRGWVGAYVMTSFFSESVQREIIEDRFPLLTINGLEVAKQVQLLAHDNGCTEQAYLNQVDAAYDSMLSNRNAEEVLRD